jgi:nucleotide-binding universal stress UspA family protein
MEGRILVPLDGSDRAERAVPLAVSVSVRSGLPVRLLHVHFPVPAQWSSRVEGEAIRVEFESPEAADAYVQEARQRIAEAFRMRVSTGVLTGEVADELVSEIGDDVALVVMTTQGQGGLRGTLLGGMARKVVHDAQVPVLLVGPSVPGWRKAVEVRVENILVALDGSPASDGILAAARRIAGWYGARIHLVGVVPVGVGFGYPSVPHGAVLESGAEEELMTQHLESRVAELEADGIAVTSRVLRDEDVAGALLQDAAENDADMIALATHARGPALRVLLGSVSAAVLKRATVPVLLLRPDHFD